MTQHEVNVLHRWGLAAAPFGLFLQTDQVKSTGEECLIGRTADGSEYVTIAQRIDPGRPSGYCAAAAITR